MADYKDPDEWISNSQIPMGAMAGTESIKSSWVATNRAVYGIAGAVTGIVQTLKDLPGAILNNVRFVYQNQDSVPAEKRGTDNVITSINSTNGVVNNPVHGNAALNAKLDKILLALGQKLPEPPAPKTYTVVAGDTLAKIAAATGFTVENLVAWNGLANPDSIEVGQVLKLQP